MFSYTIKFWFCKFYYIRLSNLGAGASFFFKDITGAPIKQKLVYYSSRSHG